MPEIPTRRSRLFCPRCDRTYTAKPGDSYWRFLERLKTHVREQHPDHDPEWFDTFPEHEDPPDPNKV